jgi:O-antigen ligase
VIWIFTATLWFGILTLGVEARWALAAFDLALFALAAALVLGRRFAVRLHPVAVLLAAAAAWGCAQFAFGSSVDPQRTLEAALGWLTNCVAFSLALSLTSHRAQRQRFLTAQLVFALLLSIGAVVDFFTISRLGPFAYRNQFAAYIESILGLAIAASIWDRRRPWVWALAGAALFASVVAAGSRAGSILCLVELIALPLAAFVRGWIPGRSLVRVAVLSVAAAAALVAVVGWETIWRRLQEPNPYALRADLVRSSLDMARERPLLGFGLGAWSAAYPGYARFDDGSFVNQAHNDWIQWADEGGVPLLAAMLAIAAMLARPAARSLWGLGLMAVFVHALVDYPFQQRPALAAFFFAMAGALAAEVTSSPERSSPAVSFPLSPRSENSPRAD